METAVGRVEIHSYILETKLATYAIIYADFPRYADEVNGVRRILDSGRDEALSKGGKLLNENDVTLGGLTGRELLVDKDGQILRVRMFLVKERLFQAIIAIPANVAFRTGRPSANPDERTDFYEATSTKFLDSFKPGLLNGKSLGEVDSLLQKLTAKETVLGVCAASEPNCALRKKPLVINGKAISLPKPEYPAIARQARVSGTVEVKVVLDEEGNVNSSSASRWTSSVNRGES